MTSYGLGAAVLLLFSAAGSASDGKKPAQAAKELKTPSNVRTALGAQPGAEGAQRVQVTVERLRNGKAQAMDPGFVFDSGDLVRFRFSSTFSGYLYVMNQTTSGRYVGLFPNEETGTQNRIEAGREYLVPMTESGWFRLEGPAGHEVVYWLVSPVRLDEGSGGRLRVERPPAAAPALNPAITPRCDDAIFRARGECIDSTAGLKPVKPGQMLPRNLEGFASAAERDMTMVKSNKSSAVSVPAGSEGPFIYTLRLAHR